MVDLAGNLVQTLVAQREAVLSDRAERVDLHVVRLPVVVVVGPSDGVARLVLPRIAEHQRLRVIELRVHLARVRRQRAREVLAPRVLRVNGPRRQLTGRENRHERVELREERGGNEGALVLRLLLDGAEEEHLVFENRTAERSAVLLAAERRLLPAGLLRQVILRGPLRIA